MFEEARKIIGAGDIEAALLLMDRAIELRPGDPQFSFWIGVALANAGRAEEARRFFDGCFRVGESWRELGRRLQKIGLYSGDPALLEP